MLFFAFEDYLLHYTFSSLYQSLDYTDLIGGDSRSMVVSIALTLCSLHYSTSFEERERPKSRTTGSQNYHTIEREIYNADTDRTEIIKLYVYQDLVPTGSLVQKKAKIKKMLLEQKPTDYYIDRQIWQIYVKMLVEKILISSQLCETIIQHTS